MGRRDDEIFGIELHMGLMPCGKKTRAFAFAASIRHATIYARVGVGGEGGGQRGGRGGGSATTFPFRAPHHIIWILRAKKCPATG